MKRTEPYCCLVLFLHSESPCVMRSMAQGDGSHLKVSGCVDVCVNIFVVYFNLKKTSLDEDFPVKGGL